MGTLIGDYHCHAYCGVVDGTMDNVIGTDRSLSRSFLLFPSLSFPPVT